MKKQTRTDFKFSKKFEFRRRGLQLFYVDVVMGNLKRRLISKNIVMTIIKKEPTILVLVKKNCKNLFSNV
jgi:hypothetical protein